MPQCEFSFECGRKGAQHNTCRPNNLPNGHIPDARWVNGARRRHGASESMNGGPLDRRDWSTKAVSPKKPGKQKGAFSNGTPAGRWRVADVPQYATANGAARFGVTQYYKPEQAAPHPSFSASEKKQKGKKSFRNEKKRGTDMTFPEGCKPLQMSLQEKEDWDKEIQDVTLKKRVEFNAVTVPYGPEDVLHFSLQDLSLWQSNIANPPVAANYSPAVHHAHPMRWRRYRFAIESEQFADAEE